MRTRRTFAYAVAVIVALASATAAIAQPRGRGTAPKPKPLAAKSDAGVEAAVADDAGAGGSVAAAADAGGAQAAAPAPTFYDGGQKPSPLNPAPNELPSGPPPTSGAVDYDKLLGDISALRARVAAVGDGLFNSRIEVSVQNDGDRAKLTRLTLSLDDGVVYSMDATARFEDMTKIYDHAVAPGRHAVTFDVERKDSREDAFKTAQRSRVIVEVPKDQRLSVEARIDADSTLGADFPTDRSGKVDLRVRVKAVARPAGK